jgi:uncharacterized protein (TIGR02453 family)
MAKIIKSNLDFLIELKGNNNRDWFIENKDLYEKNREDVISFADDLLKRTQTHDNIETISGKKALFRIYRDVRFSKDKTPYKTCWSGSFKRATKQLRGSYYFHIEPGNSFLGGGFWGPSAPDLKLIRNNILDYGDELTEIINSKEFIKAFGKLEGNQLKTCPKGFDKEHKQIDLLRYKQFLVTQRFTDEEVLTDNFSEVLNKGIKAMRPFFNYMSEALTTNENGEPLC